MVGQRPDEADLGRAERVRPRREGAERAEHLVARDHRRDDHRADPDVGDDPVGVVRVGEGRVGEVVTGQDHGPLGDRPAEHPDADGQVDRADPCPAAPAADPRVVGEAKVAGRRVDQVDHRAIGVEQAGRLVDGGDQELVDVAGAAVRVDGGPARLVGRGSAGPPRGGRAAPGWAWSPGEDTTRPREAASPFADGGYVIRPMRPSSLDGPARDVRPPPVAVACPPRRGAARATMRPDAGDPPGRASREVHPDVRLPHPPPHRPMSSSAPPSSRSPWRPATSTPRSAACCSP